MFLVLKLKYHRGTDIKNTQSQLQELKPKKTSILIID